MLDATSLAAIRLSIELSVVTTLSLLVLGTPLAWWLARGRSRWRLPIRSLVALPLVLPPSVLGFYLLVTLGANGPIGQLTQSLGWGTLAFTFWGLLIGSLVYSLPFVVQPLIIALLAVPILIQVLFNSALAYWLNRALGEKHNVACPSALIGASNFFELAVAAAISLFGFQSGAALATVVGVLIEVPVMLLVVYIVNNTKSWYERT